MHLPSHRKFDLVVSDLTDFGQSESVFTKKIAQRISKCVAKDGILAMNFESVGVGLPKPYDMLRSSVWNLLFKYQYLYESFQPTFTGGHFMFAFFSHLHDPLVFPSNWNYYKFSLETEYYTPDVHKGSFALPRKFIDEHRK